PAGARIPLAGCSWGAEEQIDFEFVEDGRVFDTWGTSLSGCITTGGPVEPTLVIPENATAGIKTIQATGMDSGQVLGVPFTVITRSLLFDPADGLAGDSTDVSGCGWVGNDQVTIEWGYPDTNNLPIRWLANVDKNTGCFGMAGDFSIEVPNNTISGPIVVEATGDVTGFWSVSSWSGASRRSNSNTNQVTFLTTPRTVTVNYVETSQACYVLTRTHNGSGTNPAASPGNSSGCSDGSYHEGEVISLVAGPDSAWSVGGWSNSDNDSSTSPHNQVVMPDNDLTVTVNYVNTPPVCYTLDKNHSGSGTDPVAEPGNSSACQNGSYLAGEVISLSASPDTGWSVSSWSSSDSIYTNSSTNNNMTMPSSDHLVTVVYAETPPTCYTLTLNHNGFGANPVATPDASSGCPSGSYLSGEVVNLSASPDTGTTAIFNVTHSGRIEIVPPEGYAGGSKTIDVFDAVVGETISFLWDTASVPFDGVGTAVADFSHEVTLPDYASIGIHTITADGSKGFNAQASIDILDNSTISVVTGGDIYAGDLIRVEGTNWAAGEEISFELLHGPVSWPITKTVTVAAGSTGFSELITLPDGLTGGLYTLRAQGNKGREAETTVTIVARPLPAFSLNAAYAARPPDLDGILRQGEWDYAQRISMGSGFFTARSDDTRLYILLDLMADTVNDSLGNDNFWLSFDIWDDQKIDPGWDLNFRLDSSGDFIFEEYSGPNSFSPRNSVNMRSAYAAGFGCNLQDGSISFTIAGFIPKITCNKHRIWEIAVDLASIGAAPGDVVRLGVRAISQSPAISEDNPPDFPTDFSELGAISLATSGLDPGPPSGLITGIGSNGFEVEITQAIQDADNSLQLVAGKDTVARVYPRVEAEAMVRTFLFGRRNGRDLPGSPLVNLATIPSAINRESLSDTSNFLLPVSWVTEGITEFTSIVESMDGQNLKAIETSMDFHERRVPQIWVFPFNEGSNANPILPANADMTAQEQVLERLIAAPSVTFIRRPWKETGINGVGETVPVNAAGKVSPARVEVTPESIQAAISGPSGVTNALTLTTSANLSVF
ncbi:hypothetical protein ACFL3I_14650, partial [Pseudomonadota bacterium]